MEIYKINDYKTHEDRKYLQYRGEPIIINFELATKKDRMIKERVPKFDPVLANKLAELIE